MELSVADNFNGCKPMIYKLALSRWSRMKHNRPDVEFDDVLAEAYMIYAWCLKNFQNDKGTKFSTYLYLQLRGRLADYYNVTYKVMDLYENIVENNEDNDNYEDNIVSKDYDLSEETDEIMESALNDLSYEAFVVLKYILGRTWESKVRHSCPSIGQMTKHIGFSRETIDSAMSEIKSFWQKRPTLRPENFFYNDKSNEHGKVEKQDKRASRVEVFF